VSRSLGVSGQLTAIIHFDVRCSDILAVSCNERRAGGRWAHVRAEGLRQYACAILGSQLRLVRIEDHRWWQILNHLDLLLGEVSLVDTLKICMTHVLCLLITVRALALRRCWRRVIEELIVDLRSHLAVLLRLHLLDLPIVGAILIVYEILESIVPNHQVILVGRTLSLHGGHRLRLDHGCG